jgi:hypothetical protein
MARESDDLPGKWATTPSTLESIPRIRPDLKNHEPGILCREHSPRGTIPEPTKFSFVSERKLWSLTKSGEIPCVRIDRAVRYDPADLRAWIAKKKGDT